MAKQNARRWLRTPSPRRPQLAAAVLAALPAVAAVRVAAAAQFNWVGTGTAGVGTWATRGDWNPAGIPAGADDAVVDQGYATVAAPAAASTLAVGDFTNTSAGLRQAANVTVGNFLGVGNGAGTGHGEYDLASGTLSLGSSASGIQVGGGGYGLFNQGGGAVNTPAPVTIGSNGAYNVTAGTLTVGSASAPVNLSVNANGYTASLNVLGVGGAIVYGTLDVPSAAGSVRLAGGGLSVGNVNFHGTPAALTWSSGTLSIMGTQGMAVGYGGQLGSFVTVGSGQVLSVAYTATVGTANGGGGLTFAGGGSLQDSGELDVGGGAGTTGTLTVSAGGAINLYRSFNVAATVPNATGIASFDHAAVQAEFLGVGGNAGANGTATFANGTTAGFDFGASVGTGGGTGAVTVTGSGAALNVYGTGYQTDVGDGGTGTVNVTAGGTVSSPVTVGSGGGNGAVVVTGTGSLWDAGAGPVSVGVGGTGSLTVSAGGTFQTSGAILTSVPAVTVDGGTLTAGSLDAAVLKAWTTGTINVTGPDGLTTGSAHLSLVAAGQTLNAEHSLAVNGRDLTIAGGTVTAGSVTVQGNLSVTGGGTFSPGVVALGANGLPGILNLSGDGSTVGGGGGSAAVVLLGGGSAGGAGTVNVGPGTVLNADTVFFQATPAGTPQNRLNLAGGTLSAATLFDLNADPTQLNWTAGTLNLYGLQNGSSAYGLTVDVAGPLGPSASLHAGQALKVTLPVQVSGTLSVDGGQLTAGGLDVAYTGTLSVRNATVYVGSGSTGQLTNEGLIALHQQGNVVVAGAAALSGRVTSDDDANALTFQGGLTLASTASLQLSAGDRLAVAGSFVNDSTAASNVSTATLVLDGTGPQQVVVGSATAAGLTWGAVDVAATASVSVTAADGTPTTLHADDLIVDGTTLPTLAAGSIVVANARYLAGAQAISASTTNPAGTPVFLTDTGTAADGNVAFANGATYTNNGTFDDENSRSFTGSGSFVNNGTFRKQAGGGTTTFAVPFSNAGLVDVRSGTLSTNGQNLFSTGQVNVGTAATLTVGTGGLYLSGGGLNQAGGSVVAGAIGVSGTAAYQQAGGTTAVSGSVQVGADAGGTGSYQLAGTAVLSVAGAEYVGPPDATVAHACFVQTGGTHTVGSGLLVGGSAAGSGTFNLAAGTLAVAGYVTVGPGGTFNQGGGAVAVAGPAGNFLYDSGAFGLSAGDFKAGAAYVGSTTGGSFVQTGGTQELTSFVAVGSSAGTAGTYAVVGGGLTVNSLAVGVSPFFPTVPAGTGTFTLGPAGSLTLVGSVDNFGTVVLAGAQHYAAGATFVNNPGATATFVGDAGANGADLAVAAGGGTVTFNGSQHLAGLTVAAGAVVSVTGPAAGGRAVVVTPSLSVSGTLDLMQGAVDDTGDTLAAVTAQVRPGSAGGAAGPAASSPLGRRRRRQPADGRRRDPERRGRVAALHAATRVRRRRAGGERRHGQVHLLRRRQPGRPGGRPDYALIDAGFLSRTAR